MKLVATLGLVTALSGALAALPPEWAAAVEQLLHNPRERTAKALEAADEEQPLQAVPYARQARELAPDDPLTHYNAGTLELAAGFHDEAVSSLEQAAAVLSTEDSAAAPPPLAEPGEAPAEITGGGPRKPATERYRNAALATSALYNLGNARFAGGDLQGAVEAYQETLRLQPDHQDAKYNLELALRELARQNPPPDASQNQEEREGEGEGESQDSPPSDQQGEEQQQEPQQGEGEEEPQPQDQPRDSSLEDFQNQPDMTAEEAAAILEAVQNLERQQRREEAAQRARQTRQGEKDW